MQGPTAKHQSSRNPLEYREEELFKPERLRTPQECNPQNQLNQAHRGSQRLKQQSLSLHRSVLSHLQICCGYLLWGFCGLPNSGSGGVYGFFLGTFFLLLSCLNMRVCAESHCIVLWCVQMTSLEGMVFSEGEKVDLVECCGITLLYAVSMSFSHWLIKKFLGPIAMQNKIRECSQTKNAKKRRAE